MTVTFLHQRSNIKDNFGDDVDNVGIKNKNEDYDKTGKYNDVDDDQTFESSG